MIPVYTMGALSLPKSGDSETSRKLHLVKWEELCKPRCVGGLSIKNMSWLNKALIRKLGHKHIRPSLNEVKRISHIWRDIKVGVNEVVTKGVFDHGLISYAKTTLSHGYDQLLVKDLWVQDVGWNWHVHSPLLPRDIIHSIALYVVSCEDDKRDSLS
ncbi:hypothetical protein V2J09_015635 [Rumex salicifolius]